MSLANSLKGSIQDELDQLFQAIHRHDVAKREVTNSAFCQARQKISHTAFIELVHLIGRFLNEASHLKTWCGHRVFAIDGSTVRLPNRKRLREEFGGMATRTGPRAMARLSVLHDVLNRVNYDAEITPFSNNESQMAQTHIGRAPIPENSLLVLDRGYIDFLLLFKILAKDHHFYLRLKRNQKVVQQLKASGLREGIFDFYPSQMAQKRCKAEDIPIDPIKVRVLRFKNGNGEDYFLMTSLLDMEAYPYEDFGDLYHERWQVEESFKIKKCRMDLEDFSGLSPEVIRQDFFGKVFLECFTTALTSAIDEAVEAYSLSTANEYKICLTQAIAKMKNVMVLLFLRKRIQPLIDDLYEVWEKSLVSAVPGRSYKRKNEGKNNVKVHKPAPGYRRNR